ncbi:NADPH-dependent FMN reductase [Amycolatopsis nigrescens]|uniref:NADPH-dependent FMN reductase n=1 Tax=Amycolatopsis nigrescens TaxID=381445 RepID=UPI000475D6DE|nr:NAD(P)H-dependent oxidoreductase [Amycolatopsis nigrescens]
MSEHNPLRLAVIVGSTRRGRFGPVAADWFIGQARRHEKMTVDVIDLAELQLPEVLGADEEEPPAKVRALAARVAAADAFVVVTPEYNHSFPASLKTAIDWFFDEWQAKPVAFVSYGGIGGGLRAVEHLRLVFAEVHATTVRDTISFHSYERLFDETGLPKDAVGVGSAAKKMLDQLGWWAHALRDARAVRPYAA